MVGGRRTDDHDFDLGALIGQTALVSRSPMAPLRTSPPARDRGSLHARRVTGAAQQPPAVAPTVVGSAPPERPGPVHAAPVLGPRHLDTGTGRFLARYGDGEAVLTLDPRLQKKLERTLNDFDVPYGATVLLDPRTGRVLAMAEHSRGRAAAPPTSR